MKKLARSILHNCVVHPLMPIADSLDVIGIFPKVSRALDWLHDTTAPREAA